MLSWSWSLVWTVRVRVMDRGRVGVRVWDRVKVKVWRYKG
jgi:hypothetical protein